MKSIEVGTFDKGKLGLIEINGGTVGRATLEPGRRWSQSVKPVANTESCPAHRLQYHPSDTFHIQTDDGAERDMKAGEVSPPTAGHSAWVVGSEQVFLIDFQGMID